MGVDKQRLVLLLSLLLLSLQPTTSLLGNEESCAASGGTWLSNAHYPATYSFTSESGLTGTDISFVDSTDATVSIISLLDDHYDVLKVQGVSGWNSLNKNSLSSPQTSGVVEFWVMVPQEDERININLIDSSETVAQQNCITFQFHNDGNLYNILDVAATKELIMPYDASVWYHMRIEFDVSTVWRLWVNGVLMKEDGYSYRTSNPSDIGWLQINVADDSNAIVYFDAVGYSWDPDYRTGDNTHAGCCGDDLVDLRDGLVSEYHFDGDVLDSIGSSDGSLVGSTSYISGQHGQALELQGSDDYMTFNVPSLDFAADGFSFSGWIYWEGYSDGVASVIFQVGTGHGVHDDNLELIVDPSNVLSWRSFTQTDGPDYTISTNTLYHVVGTIDDVGLRKLYVNGVLVDSVTNTVPTTLTAITGRLGVHSASLVYSFDGWLDEFRFYNRALSQREVEYLFEMSPYHYLNYSDNFYNGTLGVDSSYCVNGDFYTELDDQEYYCELAGNTYLSRDWWDTTWTYRKNITLTENSGSTLTNYQVEVDPQTYNTTGLVASYHFSEEQSFIKDYSGNHNFGDLYGSTIALYHFDEGVGTSIYDSTAYGNDGSFSSSPLWESGISGGALHFDGTDDYVDIPSITLGTGDWTVSAWYNPDDFDQYTHILTADDQANFACKVSKSAYNEDPYFYSTTTGGINSGVPLEVGVWNHVVYTRDGDIIKIYVNGEFANAGAANGLNVAATGFKIGNYGTEYTDGVQDETVLYDRALSDAEVEELFYSQRAKFLEYSEGYEGKGQGLEFDGVNDYLSVSGFDNDGLLDDFSFSVWAKMTSIDGATDNVFLQQRDASGGFQFGYGWGGDYYIRVLTGGGTKDITYSVSDYDEWHHYVGLFSGDSIKLYLDGELVNSESFTSTTMVDTTATFMIGQDYDGADEVFDGLIDEVFIYNRVLSADEISDMYHERKGRLDYADLRFVNSSGSELDYYCEYDDSVWVEVPELTASSSQNISMYYGNPGAVSHSSGEATFLFFDDFSDPSLSDWYWDSADGTVQASRGFANARQIKDYLNFKPLIEVGCASCVSEYTARYPSASSSNIAQDYVNLIDDSYVSVIRAGYPSGYFSGFNSAGGFTNIGSFSNAEWYDLSIIFDNSVNSLSARTSDSDSYTTYTPRYTTLGQLFGHNTFQYYMGDAGYTYIDNYLVRNYVSSEPTVSLSDEEIVVGGNHSLVAYYGFDQDVDNHTIDSVGKNTGSLYGSTVGLWHFDDLYTSPRDSTSYNNDGGLLGDTIGLWHFDEESGTMAIDESGYGEDATLVGTPTWVDGFYGDAIKTTTTSQKVYSSLLTTSGLSTITISAWIKPQTINGAYGRMLTLGTTTSNYDGAELALYSDGRLAFIALDLGCNWVVTSYTPELNKYTHFVYELSSNGNIKIYADGVKIHDTTYTGGSFSNYYLTLGSRPDLNGEAVSGEYDEVAVYNRALSQEEVSDLYHSQRAKFIEYNSTAKSGTSLSFDGVDDYVVVSADSSLQVSGDLSLSFWVYPHDLSRENYLYSAGYNNLNSLIFYYDEELKVIERDGSGGNTEVQSGETLLEDEWQLITYVREDNVWSIYVNGLYKAQGPGNNINPGSYDHQIGYSIPRNKPGVYFDGLMDEIALYDKALSSSEVAYLYNSTRAKFIEHQPSKKGFGLEFDGDSYVNISSNDLNIGTDDLTVSAWLKTSHSGTNQYVIMSPDPPDFNYRVIDTGYGRFYIRDSASHNQYRDTSVVLNDGEWHHFLATWDGSTDSINLYVDGSLAQGSQTDGGVVDSLDFSTNEIIIGGHNTLASNLFYNGLIDDVRFYKRVLTPLEVAALYSSTALDYGCCGDDQDFDMFYQDTNYCYAGELSEPDLSSTECDFWGFDWLKLLAEPISHWAFDETSGTTAFDRMGLNNPISTGSPLWVDGKYGGGVEFDEDGDYFIDTSVTGLPSGNVPRSMGAWFILDPSCGVTRHCNLGGFGDNANGQNFQIDVSATTGKFGVFGWGISYDWATSIDSIDYVDGDWHHVFVTYDGDNTLLYLDGELVDSTNSYNWNTDPSKIVIGQEIDQAGRQFIGKLDDFRIYDYELSADEVELLYDSGPNSPCCGDDGTSDNFYNGSISNTDFFCVDGSLIRNPIDMNQTICENYFNWVSGELTGNYTSNFTVSFDLVATYNNHADSDVGLADFDGDGDLDVTYTVNNLNPPDEGYLNISLNDGLGNFTETNSYSLGRLIRNLDVGDLDADGDIDIVVSTRDPGDVNIFINDGLANFTLVDSYSAGSAAWSIKLGDMNGDGDLDVVSGVQAPPSVVKVFDNDGLANLSQIESESTGDVLGLELGDFDLDGDLDVVSAIYGSDRLSLHYNDGSGQLSSAIYVTAGNGPNFPAVSDLNGDVYPDIVVPNLLESTLSIFFNNQAGGFDQADRVDYDTPSTSRSVNLEDIDFDGDLDMVVMCTNGDQINVFFNNDSLGNFSDRLDITGVDGPTFASLGDIDGDSDLDIVNGNWEIDSMTVILNQGFNDTGGACCGDDLGRDDFYSGSIGDTSFFCQDGSIINQPIDNNNTLCGFYGYNWLPNTPDNNLFSEAGFESLTPWSSAIIGNAIGFLNDTSSLVYDGSYSLFTQATGDTPNDFALFYQNSSSVDYLSLNVNGTIKGVTAGYYGMVISAGGDVSDSNVKKIYYLFNQSGYTALCGGYPNDNVTLVCLDLDDDVWHHVELTPKNDFENRFSSHDDSYYTIYFGVQFNGTAYFDEVYVGETGFSACCGDDINEKFYNGTIGSTNYFCVDSSLVNQTIDYNQTLCEDYSLQWLNLTNPPVAHYRFDESAGSIASDESGQNPGTLYNMESPDDWTAGKYGNALDFDGVNEYVEVLDNDLLDVTELTISLWTKADGVQSDSYANAGVNKNVYFLGVQNNLENQILGGVTTSGGSYAVESSTNFFDGTWKHLVLTYNTSELILYENGIVVDSDDTMSGDIISTTTDLIIGAGYDEVSNYYDGVIDDVRIYDYALSEGEIENLYYSSVYSGCCGDDAGADDFYNGSIGNTSFFCQDGIFIQQQIDVNETICNNYFDWLNTDYSNWWNGDWNSRKNITLSNSGSELNDYQVKVDPQTYLTNGLVASYHLGDEHSWVKDYSGQENHGDLYGSTVGLWHFNEGTGSTAHDETIYGNDGTLTNSPTWTTGISGNALDFDGGTEYVVVPYNSVFAESNEMSFSLWYNADSVSGTQTMLAKSLGPDESQFGIRLVDDELRCWVQTETKYGLINGVANSSAYNFFETGSWNHLVMILSASKGSLSVYKNGELIVSDESLADVSKTINTGDIYIGRDNRDQDYYDGKIDELAIYDTALTQDQITELYQSQKAEFIEYVDGYQNKGTGLEFDGVDDYVDTITNADIVSSFDSLSLGGWFYFNSNPSSNNHLIGRTSGSTSYQTAGSFGLDTDQFHFNNGVDNRLSLTYSLNEDEWYFLVGTYDGSTGEAVYYVNGVESDSNTYTTNDISSLSSSFIRLGQWAPPTYPFSFDGSMDEVFIYNRALSEEEIGEIYNEGQGRLDYADLRFTNSSGNELDYYFEYDNTTWVEVPIIPNGESNITMYYNNTQDVASESNGSETFIFFDDFEDQSLVSIPYTDPETTIDGYTRIVIADLSGGTTNNCSWGVKKDDGNKVLWFDSENNGVYGSFLFNGVDLTNAAISARGKLIEYRDYDTLGFYTRYIDPANRLHSIVTLRDSRMIVSGYGASGYLTKTSSYGQWYDLELLMDGNNIDLYVDDSLFETTTTSSPSGYAGLSWIETYGYYDDIKVRNYASTEPTITTGSSQYRGTASCCGDDALNDYFNNGTYYCVEGSLLQDGDLLDTACITLGHDWFYGTTTGFYDPCCGDDTTSDDFYNGTINNTSYFCLNGDVINQTIDYNQTACIAWGYDWIDTYINGDYNQPINQLLPIQGDTNKGAWTPTETTFDGHTCYTATNTDTYEWIHWDQHPKTITSGKYFISGYLATVTADYYELALLKDTDNYFNIRFTSTTMNARSKVNGVDSNPVLLTGQDFSSKFNHFALALDVDNNKLEIYFNGVKIHEETLAGTFQPGVYDVRLQNGNTGDQIYWDRIYFGTSEAIALGNANCCGDDTTLDDFYNGTVSNTTFFCVNGGLSNQTIDYNQTICEEFNYHWINVTNPPIAHYRFDESTGSVASDESGLNPGTLINTPTWTTGKYGNALDFDNTQSERVNTNLDLTDYTTYSISVWFKRDGKTTREIIIAQDQISDRVITLEYDPELSSGSRLASYNGANTITGDDVTIGEWVNVILVDNGVNRYLYQNGELKSSGDSNMLGSSSQTLMIGARAYTGAEDYFDGLIDDVRVYDHALSETEVESLYKSSAYSGCCGDDATSDDFYNGSISNTRFFCQDGTFTNQFIDDNQTVCTAWGYDWLDSSTGTGADCCGDDGDSDDFYNGTIQTTNNFCVDGSFNNQTADYNQGICELFGYDWVNMTIPPIAHYRLDSSAGTTAIDESGLHPGTLVNMESPGDWTAGKYSNALTFDGTNEYVDIPDDLIFGSMDFSLTAWFNRGEDESIIEYLFGKRETGWPAGVMGQIQLVMQNGKMKFLLSDSGDDANLFSVETTDTYNDSSWHQVVAVREGVKQSIYIDSRLVVEDSHTSVLNINPDLEFVFGGEVRDADRKWVGLLDDVRVYDYALSATEIQTIYGSSAYHGCCGDDGLMDDFYNGTLSTTEYICYNGFLSGSIDSNNTLCGYYGFEWLSDSTGTGTYCCGDDSGEDYANATLSCCCNAQKISTGQVCDTDGDFWVDSVCDDGVFCTNGGAMSFNHSSRVVGVDELVEVNVSSTCRPNLLLIMPNLTQVMLPSSNCGTNCYNTSFTPNNPGYYHLQAYNGNYSSTMILAKNESLVWSGYWEGINDEQFEFSQDVKLRNDLNHSRINELFEYNRGFNVPVYCNDANSDGDLNDPSDASGVRLVNKLPNGEYYEQPLSIKAINCTNNELKNATFSWVINVPGNQSRFKDEGNTYALYYGAGQYNTRYHASDETLHYCNNSLLECSTRYVNNTAMKMEYSLTTDVPLTLFNQLGSNIDLGVAGDVVISPIEYYFGGEKSYYLDAINNYYIVNEAPGQIEYFANANNVPRELRFNQTYINSYYTLIDFYTDYSNAQMVSNVPYFKDFEVNLNKSKFTTYANATNNYELITGSREFNITDKWITIYNNQTGDGIGIIILNNTDHLWNATTEFNISDNEVTISYYTLKDHSMEWLILNGSYALMTYNATNHYFDRVQKVYEWFYNPINYTLTEESVSFDIVNYDYDAYVDQTDEVISVNASVYSNTQDITALHTDIYDATGNRTLSQNYDCTLVSDKLYDCNFTLDPMNYECQPYNISIYGVGVIGNTTSTEFTVNIDDITLSYNAPSATFIGTNQQVKFFSEYCSNTSPETINLRVTQDESIIHDDYLNNQGELTLSYTNPSSATNLPFQARASDNHYWDEKNFNTSVVQSTYELNTNRKVYSRGTAGYRSNFLSITNPSNRPITYDVTMNPQGIVARFSENKKHTISKRLPPTSTEVIYMDVFPTLIGEYLITLTIDSEITGDGDNKEFIAVVQTHYSSGAFDYTLVPAIDYLSIIILLVIASTIVYKGKP